MKVLASLILLIVCFDTLACKCDEYDVSGYVKLASKAYIGELVSVSEFGNQGLLSTSLKVSERFVGQTFDVEEAIVTDGCVCGLSLEKGQQYIVFEAPNGHVDFCTMQKLDDVHNLDWNLEVLRALREKGV